jgi:hypothetical protein
MAESVCNSRKTNKQIRAFEQSGRYAYLNRHIVNSMQWDKPVRIIRVRSKAHTFFALALGSGQWLEIDPLDYISFS